MLRMRLALFLLLASLLALDMSQYALGYSAYSPKWASRLYFSSIPGEYGESVDADASYVYALYTFTYSAGSLNTTNTSLAEVYPGNGSVANAISLYVTGANTTGTDVAAYGSPYIYVVGYFTVLSDNTRGGFIAQVDKTSLTIVNSYVDYDQNVGQIHYSSVCLDSTGNVYVTGYVLNTSDEYMMLVARYSTDLSQRQIQYYVSAEYEPVGISCTMGPDGYLYAVSQLLSYNSTLGHYYPVYLVVSKIDPTTLDIVDTYSIRLYNSQGYTNRLALLDAAITSDGSYLYVAFGYTDEKPSPSSPTTGAAVVKLTTSLSQVWRLNISTDYYEEFDAARAGAGGPVIVAGQTQYDYGTGLGTNYYKSFLVIVNTDGSISKAILFGASDEGSGVDGVAIDANGYPYSVSSHFSDTISFYDVTNEVQGTASLAAISPSPRLSGEAVAAKVPTNLSTAIYPLKASTLLTNSVSEGKSATMFTLKYKRLSSHHGHTNTSTTTTHVYIRTSTTEPPGKKPPRKGKSIGTDNRRPVPQPLNPGTPSGNSSVLLVAYQEELNPPPQPPQPIPEPITLILLATITASIGYTLIVARKRDN